MRTKKKLFGFLLCISLMAPTWEKAMAQGTEAFTLDTVLMEHVISDTTIEVVPHWGTLDLPKGEYVISWDLWFTYYSGTYANPKGSMRVYGPVKIPVSPGTFKVEHLTEEGEEYITIYNFSFEKIVQIIDKKRRE